MHPTKLKQNLRVLLKLMNLQECVWEIRYRIIIKNFLQEKEKIHCSITIWFTIFPMPQAMKIPAAEAAVEWEWEN